MNMEPRQPSRGLPPWRERIGFAGLGLITLMVILPVLWIFGYIFLNGIGVISWDFISQPPRNRGLEGGILSPLVGTAWLMAGTIIFSLPIGVLAAIYLTEYAPQNWLTRLINLSIVNLAGVPSIVYGMFGVGLFVIALGSFTGGSSILSASLTLACQALAMVITSSREALLTVPFSYREASLGLGATKLQTILHIVVPQAVPGILTGVILAVGRAAGETAPILAIGAAFTLPRLPTSPFDNFMALPYHLFIISEQVPEMPGERKWATALVLLAVVLVFNAASFIIRTRIRLKQKALGG
ncbi:MAG: phosphate ABC transporter permease PstA [Anaerolineae bacterium]